MYVVLTDFPSQAAGRERSLDDFDSPPLIATSMRLEDILNQFACIHSTPVELRLAAEIANVSKTPAHLSCSSSHVAADDRLSAKLRAFGEAA